MIKLGQKKMTLEKLMEELAAKPDRDPAVDLRTLREAFVKRAGRTSEAELTKFSELTVRLLAQAPLIERMAFARQLAKLRNTPKQLLSLLTGDHYLVSAPVLESAPMLSEGELTEIIGKHGASVCLAISKRDALSVQLTDLLMTEAEAKVQQSLAGNTGARLSRKSMTALCDMAETDEELRTALSRRRDLPQALAARLRQFGGKPQATSVQQPIQIASGGPGRGRAGVVLGADVLNPKPKRKDVKTIRYS